MSKRETFMLAELIGKYFGMHLAGDRGLSQNTQISYRDSIKLYLHWLANSLGKSIDEFVPTDLTFESVKEFLRHLENDRGCTVRTRNQRHCALRNFFGFLTYERPELALESAHIKDMEGKKGSDGLVDYLDEKEMQVLLATIEGNKIGAIRDRAMFSLIYSLGLRVSELTGLTLDRTYLGSDPEVLIHGKGGARDRMVLTDTCVTVLESWMAVRRAKDGGVRLFLNRNGEPITRSGVAYLLKKYVEIAKKRCPSIGRKNVTPHVLRHSCAMRILHEHHDPRLVARFLRHKDYSSVEIYLHASAREKKRLMFELGDPDIRRGSFAERSSKVLAALDQIGGSSENSKAGSKPPKI